MGKPEPVELVCWFDHTCPWITKYCEDEGHSRYAWVPVDVLNRYVDGRFAPPLSGSTDSDPFRPECQPEPTPDG